TLCSLHSDLEKTVRMVLMGENAMFLENKRSTRMCDVLPQLNCSLRERVDFRVDDFSLQIANDFRLRTFGFS
ncbi:hypothetical protein CEXT_111821, partial [Caerostris extrusa]